MNVRGEQTAHDAESELPLLPAEVPTIDLSTTAKRLQSGGLPTTAATRLSPRQNPQRCGICRGRSRQSEEVALGASGILEAIPPATSRIGRAESKTTTATRSEATCRQSCK